MNPISQLRDSQLQDVPLQTPSQWCEENIRFDEPKNHGPFSLLGKEYEREWVDSFADRTITDGVLVKGTQLGGTTALQGGLAWSIIHDPPCCMWVMPNIKKGGETSSTRLMPMLRASKPIADLIPIGAARHSFKTMQYQIGGAIVIFQGSNSPSNVSSTPCTMVIQDEMEKFDIKATGEAGTSKLADDRVSGCPTPKRYKTSTPAMSEGMSWQALLESDLRRRFVPCPHCQKRIVLAWSKSFTVFKLTGNEAFVRWDKEARRPTRHGLESWDLERVEKSAAFICPFCAGRILDNHKTLMDRNGIYIPTKAAAKGHVGWHLPSIYGSNSGVSFGKLAIEFLTEKYSLEGCQHFINSRLAEPYMAQDTVGDRRELIISTIPIEVSDTWKMLLTADCQAGTPSFWYARGAWKDTEAQIIESGSCETWDELAKIQKAHKILDVRVGVDSGWGAQSDAEVYKHCIEHAVRMTKPQGVKQTFGARQIFAGWMPTKGFPGNKTWKNEESKLFEPFNLKPVDPFIGTAMAGQVELNLFEFSAGYFEDILDNMRNGRTGWFKFSIGNECNLGLPPVGVAIHQGNVYRAEGEPENHIQIASAEEFWRHLNGHIKGVTRTHSGMQIHGWIPRHSHWPDHILDCIKMQVALANFYGFFKIQQGAK